MTTRDTVCLAVTLLIGLIAVATVLVWAACAASGDCSREEGNDE